VGTCAWLVVSKRGMTRVLVVVSVAVLGLSAVAQSGNAGSVGAATPADRVVEGKSVHQMMLDEQSEMPTRRGAGSSPITAGEFQKLSVQRRARILALVQQGELKTGGDFYDASTIFQHGDTANDYLLAHIFAMDALVRGYDKAKWFAAATLDRYLQLVNQPQVFGTQYPLADPKTAPGPENTAGKFDGRTQEPFNRELVPPMLRTDFCVADVEQQKKNLATLNGGRYPGGASMVAPGCSR
jgi:hypothetical protein